LNRNSDPATLNTAGLYDLLHDLPRHIDGDRETYPYVTACGRQDGGVYADQPAFKVNECSTRVARIDGCIGLNEVFVTLFAKPSAAQRAHKTRGYGLSESEWVSNGDNKVANLQTVTVTHRYGFQARGTLHL